MSKAEETARHYLLNEHKSPLNQILHQADLKTELQYHTDIEKACKYGYHQAEKDLELTWEDTRELHIIFAKIDVDIELCKTNIKAETLGYYQEVLKRFNKERKEK